MRYWIIYQPGVGGHGFANLLEHADNIQPIDDKVEWRIHYRPGRFGILDRPIKFFPGNVDVNSTTYIDSTGPRINTVFSEHPTQDLLLNLASKKCNIVVHLYSSNVSRVIKDFNSKMHFKLDENFSKDYEIQQQKMLNTKYFAAHVDIEVAWRNWDYLNSQLTGLGIVLDKTYYDQYLEYIDL